MVIARMKIVLGLCLSLLSLTTFGQDIHLDSIVFNSKSYQNISKENSFDLGEVNRTGESGQTFVLCFTNTSDSPLYIEQIITGDDMVGNKKDELIASGKNGRLEFNFLTQHAGNRTQHITIRSRNQTQESQLAFSMKYVVVEKAYNHRVSGKVIDVKTGEPIPFVFVMIGKTNKGTQTDFDGLYSLDVNTNDTLSYYTVGMITQKWRADKEVIDVSMQETEQLEVVFGPPIEPRKNYDYSSTKVTAEDIKKVEPLPLSDKERTKCNLSIGTLTVNYHIEEIVDVTSQIPYIRSGAKRRSKDKINTDIRTYFLAGTQQDSAAFVRDLLKEYGVTSIEDYKRIRAEEQDDEVNENFEIVYHSNDLLNFTYSRTVYPIQGRPQFFFTSVLYDKRTGEHMEFADFFSIKKDELLSLVKQQGYVIHDQSEGDSTELLMPVDPQDEYVESHINALFSKDDECIEFHFQERNNQLHLVFTFKCAGPYLWKYGIRMSSLKPYVVFREFK